MNPIHEPDSRAESHVGAEIDFSLKLDESTVKEMIVDMEDALMASSSSLFNLAVHTFGRDSDRVQGQEAHASIVSRRLFCA